MNLSTHLGPDAPIETKTNGAKQSASPYRADLLPPLALLHISEILAKGAVKYGENNWYGLEVKDCLNHAMVHLLAHQSGDKQDDHLGHATCRMLMALDLSLGKVPDSDAFPEPGKAEQWASFAKAVK